MLTFDVNLLLYTFLDNEPEAQLARPLLRDLLAGTEPVVFLPQVLSGFLRVVTNPLAMQQVVPPRQALDFVSDLLNSPAGRLQQPGLGHWEIFTSLCREHGLKGNEIPDGWLAAAAMDLDATLLSTDQGFARFRRLRWRNPLGDAL